jgi:hypothetical protein
MEHRTITKASGRHNKDAVLLLRNIDKEVKDKVPSIVNVAPSFWTCSVLTGKKSALMGRAFFRIPSPRDINLRQRDHVRQGCRP